jgi:zinc protease
MLGRSIVSAIIAVALACAAVPARAAFQVQRVVSPGGIEAWLIEDHRVPITALRVTFRGGSALDPAGKEGLALMAASLLDEGAGDIAANQFQKELADKSIAFNFNAGLDNFSGSIKTMTRYRDRAFDLLGLALTKPRFDADAIDRVRREMEISIQSKLGDPGSVARRKLMETVFAGHPYARPSEGTPASLRAIAAQDLRAFAKARFGQDQLLVTVAGDISPAELGPALDRIFGKLPAKAAPFSVPEAVVKGAGETITIERDRPQTVITMAEAGIKRNDPDWYVGQILNHALGGGGFDSRLMEDVRGAGTKRGLAYGVSSAFTPFQHAGLIQVGSATKNATAGELIDIIKDELGKVQASGITEDEVKLAKIYISGSLVLTLTSTDRLASVLMQLREENLAIDYLDRRDALIDAVTLEQTKQVAAKLIDPARMTTILVGKPEGLKSAAAAPKP